MKHMVTSLDFGHAELTWPERMSTFDAEHLKAVIDIQMRIIKRGVSDLSVKDTIAAAKDDTDAALKAA